jgi:ABC-2 type transport system permease protein
MKIWAIGMTGLRRLFRDRSSIFFVLILPLAIILLVGAQFGSGGPPGLLVYHDDGEVATDIVAAMEGVRVERVEAVDELTERVERGHANAGVLLPDDLDRILLEGGEVEIGLVSRADTPASLRQIVSAAVSDATADLRVARIVSEVSGRALPETVDVVAGTSAPGIEVETATVGESLFGADTGQFSVGAASQLVLFVFLTTLTGSAALIQSRQLGVTTRMVSTPPRCERSSRGRVWLASWSVGSRVCTSSCSRWWRSGSTGEARSDGWPCWWPSPPPARPSRC